MRGVAYALTASVALLFGALTSASAGCYGECNGYQDNRYGRAGLRASGLPRARLRALLLTAARAITRPTTSAAKNIRSATPSGRVYRSSYYSDDGYDRGYRLRRRLRRLRLRLRQLIQLRRLLRPSVSAATTAPMATVAATATAAVMVTAIAATRRLRLRWRLWLRRLRLQAYYGASNPPYGYGAIFADRIRSRIRRLRLWRLQPRLHPVRLDLAPRNELLMRLRRTPRTRAISIAAMRGPHPRAALADRKHPRAYFNWSAIRAMPAAAQTSSPVPPGAPLTPTPPIVSLPTLIGAPPPPLQMTSGRLRRPVLGCFSVR